MSDDHRMTAQGENILAYLDREITATEQAAQAATSGVCPDWVYSAVRHVARNCQIECSHDGHQGIDQPEWDRYEDSPHINRHSPASVLRRCAADRKLIALHRPQQTGAGFPDIQECRTCSADSLGDGYQYLMPAPCPSLLALAEGYGWTDGER